MKDFLLQLKEKFLGPSEEEEASPEGESYVELEPSSSKSVIKGLKKEPVYKKL